MQQLHGLKGGSSSAWCLLSRSPHSSWQDMLTCPTVTQVRGCPRAKVGISLDTSVNRRIIPFRMSYYSQGGCKAVASDNGALPRTAGPKGA
eukprot:2216169-Pyramimonas_sp.AAC.1